MKKETNFPNGFIKKVSGRCFALKGDDIDTDRIIPARFLKCVNFESLGEQVFADDRNELEGKHPFDLNENKGASILVVNDNFGCGSSREHAPQALMRWGIRAIIGRSFAEIFYGNCLALGIPCATTSAKEINRLQEEIETNSAECWELNVAEEVLRSSKGCWKLNIENGSLRMLISGQWDATFQLIAQNDRLKELSNKLPYLNNFNDHNSY